MSIHIGDWEFDNYSYDADADVLYLSIGPPGETVGEETPEGHFLRFDEDGHLRGVTIIDARRLMDERGDIELTLPRRERLEAGDLVLAH